MIKNTEERYVYFMDWCWRIQKQKRQIKGLPDEIKNCGEWDLVVVGAGPGRADIIVRIPVIGGYNDNDEEIRQIADF